MLAYFTVVVLAFSGASVFVFIGVGSCLFGRCHSCIFWRCLFFWRRILRAFGCSFFMFFRFLIGI